MAGAAAPRCGWSISRAGRTVSSAQPSAKPSQDPQMDGITATAALRRLDLPPQ
jgi:hypothetical protein